MFLVGVERLTAVASPAASPDNPPLADGGVPVPRPPAAQ